MSPVAIIPYSRTCGVRPYLPDYEKLVSLIFLVFVMLYVVYVQASNDLGIFCFVW